LVEEATRLSIPYSKAFGQRQRKAVTRKFDWLVGHHQVPHGETGLIDVDGDTNAQQKLEAIVVCLHICHADEATSVAAST
jgi:hypothetical protein